MLFFILLIIIYFYQTEPDQINSSDAEAKNSIIFELFEEQKPNFICKASYFICTNICTIYMMITRVLVFVPQMKSSFLPTIGTLLHSQPHIREKISPAPPPIWAQNDIEPV